MSQQDMSRKDQTRFPRKRGEELWSQPDPFNRRAVMLGSCSYYIVEYPLRVHIDIYCYNIEELEENRLTDQE
jgi:hypothetical protein